MRASIGLAVPQRGHAFIVIAEKWNPHCLQNLAPRRFEVPHWGQAIVSVLVSIVCGLTHPAHHKASMGPDMFSMSAYRASRFYYTTIWRECACFKNNIEYEIYISSPIPTAWSSE